jgi:hypothetical protein
MGASLNKSDLLIIKANIDSFLLDYNTVKNAGKITDVQQALIIDKYNIIVDATTQLKDMASEGQTVDMATYNYIAGTVPTLPDLVKEIQSMTATPTDGTISVPLFRQGVPFCSFVQFTSSSSLKNSDATMKALAIQPTEVKFLYKKDGVTTDITQIMKAQLKAGVSGGTTYSPASGQSIPVGVLVAAGIAAFLLLNK